MERPSAESVITNVDVQKVARTGDLFGLCFEGIEASWLCWDLNALGFYAMAPRAGLVVNVVNILWVATMELPHHSMHINERIPSSVKA